MNVTKIQFSPYININVELIYFASAG